jgi:hypothetical protein
MAYGRQVANFPSFNFSSDGIALEPGPLLHNYQKP